MPGAGRTAVTELFVASTLHVTHVLLGHANIQESELHYIKSQDVSKQLLSCSLVPAHSSPWCPPSSSSPSLSLLASGRTRLYRSSPQSGPEEFQDGLCFWNTIREDKFLLSHIRTDRPAWFLPRPDPMWEAGEPAPGTPQAGAWLGMQQVSGLTSLCHLLPWGRRLWWKCLLTYSLYKTSNLLFIGNINKWCIAVLLCALFFY